MKNLKNEVKTILARILWININEKDNTIKVDDLVKIMDEIADRYGISNEKIANKLSKNDTN